MSRAGPETGGLSPTVNWGEGGSPGPVLLVVLQGNSRGKGSAPGPPQEASGRRISTAPRPLTKLWMLLAGLPGPIQVSTAVYSVLRGPIGAEKWTAWSPARAPVHFIKNAVGTLSASCFSGRLRWELVSLVALETEPEQISV